MPEINDGQDKAISRVTSEHAPKIPPPVPARHQSHYYALFALALAGLFLFWVTNARLQDFKRSQETVANTTVHNARARIEELVAEKHRLVQLFANKYEGLIDAVYHNPDIGGAEYKALEAQVRDFFPDFFAITVADPDGKPVVEDFEGYVGEVCIADMHLYTTNGELNMRIHPNPYQYHVDVMAPWKHEGATGMFFISFKPDFIANLLRAVEPLNHGLMLVGNDGSNMIEITSSGARNSIPDRNDFRLTQDELQRVLHQEPVPGTAWSLMDLRREGYFEAEASKLKFVALGLFAGIAVVISVLWLLSFRMEKRRLAAEASLKDSLSAISSLNSALLGKQHILDEEKELAAEVFERLTLRYPVNRAYLQLYSRAMSDFNGDLVLVNEREDGVKVFSISDFTGHGLPAALGAMPYADVFYATTRKLPLTEVIQTINNKLHDLLPLSRFCCSVLLEADPMNNRLTVFSAGMPDFLVLFADGSKRSVPSNFYPIGIRKISLEEIPTYQFALDEIKKIYIYSDGASEIFNEQQEMLGAERLESFLTTHPFNGIEGFINDYRGNSAPTDDVTILEIDVQAMLSPAAQNEAHAV